MSDKLKKVIGARAKYLRESLSDPTTQDELAQKLTDQGYYEVTQGQIGHIEAARRLPSVELFVALAEFFGTSLDYIAGRTDNQSSLADIEEDLQTGGVSGRLGDTYKALPAKRQEEVYKFAKAQEILAQAENGALSSSKPSSVSKEGTLYSTDGTNSIGPIFAVMKKRMRQEDINEIIDEVLEIVPAWHDLIIQYRESSSKKPPSKKSGLEG